jgi:hypothetical protein
MKFYETKTFTFLNCYSLIIRKGEKKQVQHNQLKKKSFDRAIIALITTQKSKKKLPISTWSTFYNEFFYLNGYLRYLPANIRHKRLIHGVLSRKSIAERFFSSKIIWDHFLYQLSAKSLKKGAKIFKKLGQVFFFLSYLVMIVKLALSCFCVHAAIENQGFLKCEQGEGRSFKEVKW